MRLHINTLAMMDENRGLCGRLFGVGTPMWGMWLDEIPLQEFQENYWTEGQMNNRRKKTYYQGYNLRRYALQWPFRRDTVKLDRLQKTAHVFMQVCSAFTAHGEWLKNTLPCLAPRSNETYLKRKTIKRWYQCKVELYQPAVPWCCGWPQLALFD